MKKEGISFIGKGWERDGGKAKEEGTQTGKR